ncbi:MAG TPA: hypothetical protein VHZ96_10390 [Frankiaceae bacterium]|nr:hypothetical protein [Frankiaceae bacterium]
MREGHGYRRIAIASAAAATALVAGCGSSSSGASGGNTVIPSGSAGGTGVTVQALLAGSVDKTLAAKNAKLRLDFTGSVAGQNISFGGDGIADFANKTFQLSLQLPAAAGISGTIEERVIGKDIYLMLPAAESAATGGKPWVKIDASDFSASSTTGLNLTQEDPTQLLNTLRGVSDSVTKVGTAEVRGVQTTHYRAEVDLAKAVKASGADASSLNAFTKTLGSQTIPEDVYLDSSGLARRFSVTIKPVLPSSSAASSAGPVSFAITVDLYDFGSTDTSGITAPPASEVGTLPTGLGTGSATG